jgi:hypothetical protein
MTNLIEVTCERDMTQNDAAALFDVTQPRIYDLIRRKINLFLDTLLRVELHERQMRRWSQHLLSSVPILSRLGGGHPPNLLFLGVEFAYFLALFLEVMPPCEGLVVIA